MPSCNDTDYNKKNDCLKNIFRCIIIIIIHSLILIFCSYFEEPWACAVFHDRFPDFIDEVKEHLGQLPKQVTGNMYFTSLE